MAAKAARYLAMGDAGISKVQLARKLGCDEKEARRMLDPRHPTKLPRIKEAFDVPGKRLVVSVERKRIGLVRLPPLVSGSSRYGESSR
jgi:antitoxin HicB